MTPKKEKLVVLWSSMDLQYLQYWCGPRVFQGGGEIATKERAC